MLKPIILGIAVVFSFSYASVEVVESIKHGEVDNLVKHCKKNKTKQLSGVRELSFCMDKTSRKGVSLQYHVNVDDKCQVTEEVQAVSLNDEFLKISQIDNMHISNRGIYVSSTKANLGEVFIDFSTGAGELTKLSNELESMNLVICQRSDDVNNVVID